jgi:hypothetical protein
MAHQRGVAFSGIHSHLVTPDMGTERAPPEWRRQRSAQGRRADLARPHASFIDFRINASRDRGGRPTRSPEKSPSAGARLHPVPVASRLWHQQTEPNSKKLQQKSSVEMEGQNQAMRFNAWLRELRSTVCEVRT